MANHKTIKSGKITVWFIVLLLLTGCWSKHEINNLSPVNILGVDRDNNGDVVLTAYVPRPSVLYSDASSAGGSTQNQEPSLVVSASGKSLFEAVGKLSDALSESIYLGHVNTVIFGEQAARYDLKSSLDFFSREDDFRPNMQLLFTKGQARSILEGTTQLNKTLGLDIQNMISSNKFSSTAMVRDLSQFIRLFDSDTQDPISGEISYVEMKNVDTPKVNQASNQSRDSNKNSESQNRHSTLALNGTAVFKRQSLIGWLNERETRGLLWLLGDAKNEVVVFNCGKQGTVSLRVNESSARMVPNITGGEPQMTVNIHIESNIGQVTCPNFNVETKHFDQLKHQFASLVHDDIHKVIKKAKQQWETDIFGFGREINKRYPREWEQMKDEWRKNGLKEMPIKINITTDLSRYGLTKQSNKANEPPKEAEN